MSSRPPCDLPSAHAQLRSVLAGWIARAILLALLLACGSRTGRAENFTAEEFEARVKEWKADKSAIPRVRHRVEGRKSLQAQRVLRLKDCEVTFEGDVISKLDPSAKNVEVRGILVRDSRTGELRFEVDSVRVLPSDLETFKSRRSGLRGASAEKWYALADWGAARARVYKDELLAEEALKARNEGLQIERRELSNADAPALFQLAEKARTFGASEAFLAELNHEGCILLWQQLSDRQPAGFDAFLQTCREKLAGCDEPLRGFDHDLQERYLKQPTETWKAATVHDRGVLKRFLYANVLLRKLQGEIKPDNSNLLEIAAAIERQIPEERRHAEQLRSRALALRAQDVEKLTRTEVLALQADYRKRGQPDAGRQHVETWLALKRRQLDPDDADGAIELADQYRSMLDRPELGDQLLIDAWSRHPGSTELAERLEKRGYRLHEGRWLTAEEFARRPESRFEKAIRAGRVEQGMTAGQVRKARGEPQRLARIATAGSLVEQWTYTQGDGSRQIVRFERRGGQPEPVVVGTAQPALQ